MGVRTINAPDCPFYKPHLPECSPPFDVANSRIEEIFNVNRHWTEVRKEQTRKIAVEELKKLL